jgi:AcrR family transcriptional regulator
VSQPVTWGPTRPERADAARNRRVLLAAAREMLAEEGADKLTMDALAERAGVGKGTVFRRFRSRAGIFHALLDDDERVFQQQVLSGSPPLGPGAGPLDRLIAFGYARVAFLIEHREIARAALDGRETVPAGSQSPMSREHVRYLLGQLNLDAADLDVLATQLGAALDGPPLLYLSSDTLIHAAPEVRERLGRGWEDLIRRVCQSPEALSSRAARLPGPYRRVLLVTGVHRHVGAVHRPIRRSRGTAR